MIKAPILVIARLTLKEAVRRKIVLGALLLGLVFLLVFGLGMHFTDEEMSRTGQAVNALVRNQMLNFLLLSGLYAVNFLFAAVTVLASVDTIAGEIASGTIHALAAKPIRRFEILIGKWLGLMIMLTVYLVLMTGGVIGLTRIATDYQPHHVLEALVLLWLNGFVLLSLTLLGGTRFSTLANGVLVFAGFGVAFVGGWVEQIGSLAGSAAAVKVGIVSSLLVPTEALWRRAAYEMRSVMVDAVGVSPFTSGASVPSQLMIVYAGVYAIVALALAVWRFGRQDL